jgi:hypothetical protein
MNVTLVPAPAATPARPSAQPGTAGPAGRRRAATPARTGGPIPGVLWGTALAAAALLLGVRLARTRRRLRCEKCRARMQRLARIEAFAHLDDAERTEQLVGDVQHEVWRCPECGGIAKHARERALPETARRLVPPAGSAADLRRRSRQGPSLFGGTLDAAERSGRPASTDRGD